MIALPSLQVELAAAVRRVNAAYCRSGEPASADLGGASWGRVEAEVDASIDSGDRSGAMAAIESWECMALDAIAEAVG